MDLSSGVTGLYGPNVVVSDNNINENLKNVAGDVAREACSFYHLSIDELVRRVKLWRQTLPRVVPHYAVKCNDHITVLKTFALMGLGFDCASRTEMAKVLSLGVSPSKIVFAHPCKVASHIKYSRDNGITRMTFDSHEELNKVSRLYPSAELLLRIRCDAASAQCQLGIKFGVHPCEARALLRHASSLQLRVVGVAFHVGSGCSEPTAFLRAIAASKQVFVEAEEEGHTPNLLDIGGGYLGSKDDTLEEVGACINEALDEHFPLSMGVEVIAEPGRFMVASAFTLATPIINKRDTRVSLTEILDTSPHLTGYLNSIAYKDSYAGNFHSHESLLDDYNPNHDCMDAINNATMSQLHIAGSESINTTMYFIDDGIYGSFNCLLYDHQVVKPRLLQAKEGDSGGDGVASVWGPTCDGIDQVMKAILLPRSLSVGEWLVWDEMGAYTIAVGGSFNGFPLPGVISFMHTHTSMFLEDLMQQLCLEDSNSNEGFSSPPSLVSEDELSSSMSGDTRSSSPGLDSLEDLPSDEGLMVGRNKNCSLSKGRVTYDAQSSTVSYDANSSYKEGPGSGLSLEAACNLLDMLDQDSD